MKFYKQISALVIGLLIVLLCARTAQADPAAEQIMEKMLEKGDSV
jgi:hypothetical protein